MISGVSAHQACSYRSYAFERTRNSRLEGFVRKSTQVNNREDCLAACLTEESFICRSANYNYNTFFCEMSDQDKRSKPQNMRTAYGEPVDYFDNNCLTSTIELQMQSSYIWHGYDYFRTKSLRTNWRKFNFRENIKFRNSLLRSHAKCGISRIVLFTKMSRFVEHFLSFRRIFSIVQKMYYIRRGYVFQSRSARPSSLRRKRLLWANLCRW